MRKKAKEEKDIIIKISKQNNIVNAIQTALEASNKKYITIKPSEQQTIQSTQEGTLMAEINTIKNIAG